MGKAVAFVCMILGLVGLIAAGIAGIAFQSSKEFVVATLTCNPEAEDSLATDDNCVDNVVVDTDGEVCQIGALGLFQSDFTPECSYGTAYAINPLLTPQTGVDPTEFGVLFPAQNQLGGLGVEAALNITEFDNCEDYFALDGKFAQTLQGLAVGGVNAVIGGLALTLKENYDESLVNATAAADATFESLPTLLLTLAAAVGGPGLGDTFDSINGTYVGLMDAAIFNLGGTTPLAQIVGLAKLVQIGTFNVNGCGGIPTPTGVNCLALGLTDSSPGYDPSFEGYTGGILDDGYFSPLDGFICNAINPGQTECTFAEFFTALAPLAGSVEQLAAVPGLVSLISVHKQIADSQLPEGVTPEFALENIRNGTALGDGLVTSLYGKAAMVTILQSLLSLEGAVPESLFGIASDEQPGFEIVCGGAELLGNCSFSDIIDAQLEDPKVSPELKAQLELGDDLLAACEAVGVTTLSACISQVAIFADFGGETGVPIDGAVNGVLGGLYGIENVSFAEALEAAEDACEDDELDAAAIVQAQMLVPPGVALGLVGAGVGVAALVVYALANKKMAKVIVVLGGILSLVGAVLVLVGLLGVQQAPIFESVGGGDGDDDIEDGGRLFSTGQGSLLALVAIGGGIVGSIVMTIGGILLPTADDGDVLAAKA